MLTRDELTLTLPDDVLIIVGATGANLSYQWQYSTNNTVFNDLAGETNQDLMITSIGLNEAGFYRVIVSGNCPPAITSDAAEIKSLQLKIIVSFFCVLLSNFTILSLFK